MRFTRFFQILALLALLLAPAGMLGSHAAMAMPHEPAATSMDRCDRKQAPEQDRQAMLDCAIACTAMPAAAPLLAPEQPFIEPLPVSVPVQLFEGTAPEAADPPPRLS